LGLAKCEILKLLQARNGRHDRDGARTLEIYARNVRAIAYTLTRVGAIGSQVLLLQKRISTALK
jgi:hypothetical protein